MDDNQNPIKKIKRNVSGFVHGLTLKLAVEGAVQQGFFQFIEGGELLLVDGFEALDFDSKVINLVTDRFLHLQAWQAKTEATQIRVA